MSCIGKRFDTHEDAVRVVVVERPAATQRGIKIGIRQFDEALEIGDLAVGEVAMFASAKRPRMMSISRVPRCQQRNSKRLRR